MFLYLYPIKEFASTFLLSDESLYDTWHILKPMPILNETIDRRYRQKDYQVIFVMFPDKKIYGIDKKEEDKIIYTDTLFLDINAYDERGNEKKNFIPKYPDEDKIIEKYVYSPVAGIISDYPDKAKEIKENIEKYNTLFDKIRNLVEMEL